MHSTDGDNIIIKQLASHSQSSFSKWDILMDLTSPFPHFNVKSNWGHNNTKMLEVQNWGGTDSKLKKPLTSTDQPLPRYYLISDL